LSKKIGIVFIFLLVLLGNLFPKNGSIGFEVVSLEQGLSQASVNCMLQDRQGFLWFGTQDGLNRYDGYDFKFYKSQPGKTNSLSDDHIRVIIQDRYKDVLWVGTYGGGLNRIDLKTDSIKSYRHDPNDDRTLAAYSVFNMYQDRSGIIWLGTWGGGMDRFDPETETITHYRYEKNKPGGLSHNIVRAIYEDRQGNMWVGTYGGGLNRFDPQTGKCVNYHHDRTNPNSLSHDQVMVIHETRQGELWIGTDGGGINIMNPNTGTFQHFLHNPKDSGSISYNRIRAIHEDQQGTIWVGTYGGGVARFDPGKRRFRSYRFDHWNDKSLSDDFVLSIIEDFSGVLWFGTLTSGVNKLDRQKWKFIHYRSIPNEPNSLSARIVRTIVEGSDGVLWIGTNGGGLNKFDRRKNRFTHYRHNPDDKNSLSYDRIYALYTDPKEKDILWIGTFDGGLNRFDIKNERFTHYKHDPGDPTSINNNRVRSICRDIDGSLWLGLWRGGVDKFDPRTQLFTHYSHQPDDPHSLSYNNVFCIYKDRSHVIWIGTIGGGLNRYDRQSRQFIRYRTDPHNSNSLSSDRVMSIHEDLSGIMWIGTSGGGLNRFDRKTNRWKKYSIEQGLPNEVVYSILEDDAQNLWLSTNRGLSRFHPKKETFYNYVTRDGLQANEFVGSSALKTANGEMFFGGINGFNSFIPAEIVNLKNLHIPPVYITGFKKFNHAVKFPKRLSRIKEIELSYHDNFFSFDFVALNYCSTEGNQYAYKMEGFDKDWVYCGSRRSANYTNLNGGQYTFRVKASNNDGVWNEKGASIGLIITPPIWRTIWFRVLASVILILLIVMLIRFRTYRMRRRNMLLEKINVRLNDEISERKQVEIALQASEEKYRDIYENSIDVHYRADMEGKLVMASSSGIHLLGYGSKDEMIGRDLATTFYYDPKERERFLDEMKKYGKVINLETRLKKKNGDPIDIETSAHFVFDDKGVPVAVEGMFRDITSRKRAEADNVKLQNQLIDAKKMEAVGTLAGGMAHEFNNLMAVIDGNSHMLLDHLPPDSTDIKQVKAIVKASHRCSTMTNQLLSYSKKQMLKLKTLNLNDLIIGMKSSIHRILGKPVEILTILEPNTGQIKVDSEQMIQVVMGIVENARDAMPNGGTLTIGTKSVTFTKDCCDENTQAREGDFVRLSFVDTGIGMDEDTLQHIFEPFFTTKKVGQGTGLDLSFVYGTISQHNGWITVHSKPQKGTTMNLYLPVFK
jgi:PAS domain S-box-containing protein